MLSIFDYIYFRLAKFFFKKDGSFAPRAIAIVTLVQSLILWILIRFTFNIEDSSFIREYYKTIVVVFGVSVLVLNYRRYNNKYREYSVRWRGSETSTQRRIRDWLVVLGILISFIISVGGL